jgi:hypothetical protein
LIPGYRGLITLARRSGELRTVKAAAVYENEPFSWNRINPELSTHGFVNSDPGKLSGAWTLWTFKDGEITGEYMPIWEIDKIMARTKSRNRSGEIVGPWITDKPEMAKKTVIRRHFKLAPVSIEEKTFATAVQAEDVAITAGPEGQRRLFLPDIAEPEIDVTAEDFDNEFADIANDPLWENYWTQAANFHAEKKGMSEDELKVDIMKDGADQFREGFERFVNSAGAKKAEPKKEAKAKDKKAGAAKSKPKTKTQKQKDKEFDDMVQSDHFQELTLLKSENPEIYTQESGGKEPRTIPACIDLVDRISARIQVSEDMPG